MIGYAWRLGHPQVTFTGSTVPIWHLGHIVAPTVEEAVVVPFTETGGTGLRGYFALSAQNSFNVAQTTGFETLEFLSENITPDIARMSNPIIANRFSRARLIKGKEIAKGTLNFDADPLKLGHFLKGTMGGAVTSNVTSVSGYQDNQHVFTTKETDWDRKSALPPYTFHVYKGTGDLFEFTDTIIDQFKMDIKAGNVLKCHAGIIASVTSTQLGAVQTYTNVIPWDWSVASISLGGNAIELIDFGVIISNKIQPKFHLNASNLPAQYRRNALTEVLVSGKFCFETNSEYLKYKDMTDEQFIVYMDTVVSSGPTLKIDIPKFTYRRFGAPIQNKGQVIANFTAEGQLDTTSNYAAEFTLINTITSY